MVYFSFLDSWLGVGGQEQVPHLSAQRLFLETAERSTIWLLRWLEPDSSDQGQASCLCVPFQLALPAILPPHGPKSEHEQGELPASFFLIHSCLFGLMVLLTK